MDNYCLFEEKLWIPEVDTGCRMWKCPDCKKRMIGQPLNWDQFNYYNYCPYCGTKLITDPRFLTKEYIHEENNGEFD